MKRIALFSIGWSVVLPRETQEEDMARVFQILGWLGQEKLFDPTRNGYYVEVEVGSEMFNRLAAIAFDKNLPELRRIVNLCRIEHRYSHEELLSAPLLIWYVTNQSIEDDHYDMEEPLGGPCTSHRHCPACRGNVEQVRDLLVNTRKMSKRGISLTYGYKIILAPWLVQMIQEAGFTGFGVRPVWHFTRPYVGDPPLYQLVPTHTLPPIASPPTRFTNVKHCSVCGRTTLYLDRSREWDGFTYYEDEPVYYSSREALSDAKDFNRTFELFGEPHIAEPMVLISPRVYQWLREQKVKGWSVEAVHLVEEAQRQEG